jgi:hypothetical protein
MTVEGGVKKKRALTPWQKFVKKHLGSKEVQALPFEKRLKKVSEMWKKDNSNPINKKNKNKK